MKQKQIDGVLIKSLGSLSLSAADIVRGNFCVDCPKRLPGCFPCKNARAMIKFTLAMLVEEQSSLN